MSSEIGYARADFTWGRDAALARGAGARPGLRLVRDPETKARRLAGIAPAVTLSEYERRVDPNWRFGASSFLVLGLDAVSRTPVAAAGGAQPRPEIIPADSLARPVDENTWPFETVDDVAYPIAPSALPGAFRRIRFVTGFELDSLRILGNWYSATDPLVWRARPMSRRNAVASNGRGQPRDAACRPQARTSGSLPAFTRLVWLKRWTLLGREALAYFSPAGTRRRRMRRVSA
jgi:hypothetical protein